MLRPAVAISNPKDARSHGLAPVVGRSFVRLVAATFGAVTVVVVVAGVVAVVGVVAASTVVLRELAVVVVGLTSGATTAVHWA
jgi:hypothetical protein